MLRVEKMIRILGKGVTSPDVSEKPAASVFTTEYQGHKEREGKYRLPTF
jgi:hypothetical protein